MSTPLTGGVWHVVTNQASEVLNITNVDGQGNVTGTIQVDAAHTYNIAGTWNAPTNELNFSYTVPFVRNSTGSVSVFQGYFFEGANSGLFGQPPGPVSGPPWNSLLAGTFTVTGPIVEFGGFTGGWVARLANDIMV